MNSNKISSLIADFSPAERIIFFGLVLIFAASGFFLLYQVSNAESIIVPAKGGTLTEGIVGSPRFVNPLLATSDADLDLTRLTYAGLVKENPDGSLSPNLASSWNVSSDGLTYTFTLNPNATFSDGSKVTASDVVFTIEKAGDSGLKTPEASAFAGVTATAVNPTTVQVTLPQAYSPFIYSMTIGILPQHIWGEVSDNDFPFSAKNIKPVGEGPYVVTRVVSDSSGLPTEYDLTANKNYVLGEPYITTVVLKFYQSENDLITAYNQGTIDAFGGVSPGSMSLLKSQNGITDTATLSRIFGVFFNESSAPVLLDPAVRQALDVSLDKQAIVDQILGGYGHPLMGPLPTDIATSTAIVGTTTTDRITVAKSILENAGWKIGADGIFKKTDKKGNVEQLSFSLSTSDVSELKAAAEMIQATWTALGAKINVQIFQAGDLNQNVIAPRKYDALLFGEVIPAGNDLYPFWDSSQRNDPGLNIALYTNVKADKALEQFRQTTDPDQQANLLSQFETQIANDQPAIFLYSPEFIYVAPKNIQGMRLDNLISGSDHFDNIYEWYIATDKVWKIFQKK